MSGTPQACCSNDSMIEGPDRRSSCGLRASVSLSCCFPTDETKLSEGAERLEARMMLLMMMYRSRMHRKSRTCILASMDRSKWGQTFRGPVHDDHDSSARRHPGTRTSSMVIKPALTGQKTMPTIARLGEKESGCRTDDRIVFDVLRIIFCDLYPNELASWNLT